MKVLAVALLAATIGCSSGSSSSSFGFTANGSISGTGGFTGSNSGTSSSGGTGAALGSVQYQWSFIDEVGESLSCAQAGVGMIQIAIEGNQINFPCADASGQQQGTVAGVAPGDISYTLVAYAADDVTQVASSMPSDVIVTPGAQVVVAVQLTAQGQVGAIGLSWAFLGNLTCAEAAVTQISVQLTPSVDGGLPLDGGPQWTFPCEPFGDGGAGALIQGVPAGLQTLIVEGLGVLADGGPIVTWGGGASVTVTSGSTPADALLTPATPAAGSVATFEWTFQGLDCADAGEPTLLLGLAPPDGGDSGVQIPCSLNGMDGTALTGLIAGPYGFTLTSNPGDAGSTPLFASGTFFVNGLSAVEVIADLVPTSGGSTGALSIGYQLGDLGACGDAGLDAIETRLFGPSGAPVTPLGDVATPCGDLPVAFGPLPAGVYFINAQGVADAVQEYALFGLGLTVAAGATSSYVITLPPVAP